MVIYEGYERHRVRPYYSICLALRFHYIVIRWIRYNGSKLVHVLAKSDKLAYIGDVDISADGSVPRDTVAFAGVYLQNFDTTGLATVA